MNNNGYRPLIHCITNPISMMQCANTVLGLGARPIMAEHPLEVREITATADALLLNLGNISDTRMEAMEIALEEALRKEIPVVIDAVGVSCSELRRRFFTGLMEKRGGKGFCVIKGNYSEIMALKDKNYRAEGVDAKAGITKEAITEAALELSVKHNAMVLASGACDVVTDGVRTEYINNGCPELSMITGTGCMLGAAVATFLSVKRNMAGVTDACNLMGIAGEIASEAEGDNPGDEMSIGSGTFLIRLLDAISLMTEEMLQERRR